MSPQVCGDISQALSTGKWVLNVKTMVPFIIDLASATAVAVVESDRSTPRNPVRARGRRGLSRLF
jgi:hypothetical protein